jgi:hypothetical protein
MQVVEGGALAVGIAHGETDRLDSPSGGLWSPLGPGGGGNQGATVEQGLDPLQAHLAGLKGVEGETEQGGWKDQPLDVEHQGHQITDAEAAAL